jgi:predicted  nucleic acid-binding Zn-ribbon protein
MDFLKELFGGKPLTFEELVTAINAHNGDEANKEKQIKIGNLGSGEYVGKGKYDALQALFDGQKTELDTANGLIAELKKGTKGNEELQTKISGYETQVADLQKQLAETKVKSALKVALLSENALDVDYLTFKLNEKMRAENKSLEVDENEKIKGWDDLLSGLKTQFPAQFKTAKGAGIDPNPLPDGDHGKAEPQTLADALRMQYETK